MIQTCPSDVKRRSVEQNKHLWAALSDIANQVVWYGHKLTPDDWKHVLTASLKKQKVVPAIDGDGFVVIGASTSKMSVAEMTELIELCYAFGAMQGVDFADPPA